MISLWKAITRNYFLCEKIKLEQKTEKFKIQPKRLACVKFPLEINQMKRVTNKLNLLSIFSKIFCTTNNYLIFTLFKSINKKKDSASISLKFSCR